MPEAISPELRIALKAFAVQKKILIALDFDGTLAPLVDDPEASRMIAPAREALETLTPMSGVTIALVTGRAIDSVKRVADPLDEWFLVGSHGVEVLSPGELRGYETPWLVPSDLIKKFEAVVAAHPGTRLERKPFGLALHTRGVEQALARDAESAAHHVCDAWGGELVVRTGHGIVECSINSATKGDGIAEIRRRLGPTAVLFAGDDRTDEDGFAVLGEHDVAIRVGGGVTIAPYRLDDPEAVAEALWFVQRERASLSSPHKL
jgi:trehalose-phosphatase